MKTIEYTTTDKTSWGEGDWIGEIDKKQWRDEETGYACLIVRNIHVTGALCGYVGVTKQHSLYGVNYQDSHESTRIIWDKIKEGETGKRGVVPLMCYKLSEKELPGLDMIFDVHGSLTFSGECHHSDDPSKGICHLDSSNDNVWWLGFDCSHAGDVSPKMDAKIREVMGRRERFLDEEYRNFSYVIKEVESLAWQLKEVERINAV